MIIIIGLISTGLKATQDASGTLKAQRLLKSGSVVLLYFFFTGHSGVDLNRAEVLQRREKKTIGGKKRKIQNGILH